jgi:hypothetical protein
VAGHGDLTKLGDAKANGTRLNSEPSSNSKQGEALEWAPCAPWPAGRPVGTQCTTTVSVILYGMAVVRVVVY